MTAQTLAAALIADCLHQPDAAHLLDALAGRLRAALGCQVVAFFARPIGESSAPEPLPLVGSLPPVTSPNAPLHRLEAGAASLLSQVAHEAIEQRALARQTLASASTDDACPETAPGEVLALPLLSAGNQPAAVVLARSGQAFTPEQIALLDDIHAALTLAVSYALARSANEQAQRKQGELEAHQRHSSFISMVSHELRTPLHSISGFLSIVLEEHVGPLNERQREFLNYIHSSTEHLKTLVDDLLFLSGADMGRFELRPAALALHETSRLALREARPQARKLGVKLHQRVPRQFPKLWADDERLGQVLRNLLSNALKFTPPAGSVTLRARQVGELAEISVSDTGCGIPWEDQPRVFERFYQSDNTLLVKHGGFGLGLTIARLIVEQHGGRIWLRSAPEQGSTFTFTIPLFRDQTQTAVSHARPSAK
jgi:signal transduction histidine kinase